MQKRKLGSRTIRVGWAQKNTNLFVGDLDSSVSNEMLRRAFGAFGALVIEDTFMKVRVPAPTRPDFPPLVIGRGGMQPPLVPPLVPRPRVPRRTRARTTGSCASATGSTPSRPRRRWRCAAPPACSLMRASNSLAPECTGLCARQAPDPCRLGRSEHAAELCASRAPSP
jgi:hypothetical protein